VRRLDAAVLDASAFEGGVEPPHSKALRAFSWLTGVCQLTGHAWAVVGRPFGAGSGAACIAVPVFAGGRPNPSPVRRRLEKSPSPDTLSPREGAVT